MPDMILIASFSKSGLLGYIGIIMALWVSFSAIIGDRFDLRNSHVLVMAI